ncbi:MAG: T9SS type A sorting domain-containing protein, partial [Cryomorphaceae bacterium]
GNVILAGYFGGEADFDPSDNEFILARESTEPFDAFVSQLNPDGELLYAANFGGSNFTDHHGVDTDADGNIYLSAAYQNTVDINPSPDEADSLSVVAFRDNYIIKLTAENTVSVQNENLPAISLYPNPTTDRIMVEGITGTHYRIIDALGKTVDQGIFNGQHINIGNLRKGFYFLKADGYRSAKIVKQ